jgi:hypothetical protein
MTINFDCLLKQSRQIYESPRIVQNFCTQQEIDFCLDIYDSSPVFEPASHNRATRKDYQMTDNKSDLCQMFWPKLQSIYPNQEIILDGGNFTTWHEPVIAHTDAYQLAYKPIEYFEQERLVMSFAVLVPLRTDTGQGKPYTVFFDQCLYGPANIEISQKDHNNIPGVGTIDHYTFKDFDHRDPYYHMISHNSDDKLYGLSVDRVLEWLPGSAIIWHRSQYHCSSIFQGFNSKTHMVFFLAFRYQ